jgi:hypothetical protein
MEWAEWLITSGHNEEEIAEDVLLTAADALLEYDVGDGERAQIADCSSASAASHSIVFYSIATKHYFAYLEAIVHRKVQLMDDRSICLLDQLIVACLSSMTWHTCNLALRALCLMSM